ncbi:hypothetical protein Vadar_031932 [Vaccinium darrowii]|uniref:Uncharacterized protein n=1 Tax=Vaccinium darrowii TaxID=229202 RepID=A0ACB7YRC6_9ERIC|nr:hypothetical protein Vadar_031932 [Vaccinium darrowii]
MENYEKLEKEGEGTYGKVYKAKDKETVQLVALKKRKLEMDHEGVSPTALREVSLLQMLSQSEKMEKYDKLEKVGEGTYGKVYKAKDKETGQLVALKKRKLEMDQEGVPPTALREVSLLQMLPQSGKMEKYEKLEKVGEGTYGKVYKAKDKETGQLVALKKTKLEMDQEGVPQTALREVSLLQMLPQSGKMEKYEKLEKVGEGTYGKVYKAKDKETGQLVALKKTKLEMDQEGVPQTALREVSLLQMLSQSLYIVRLFCVERVDSKKEHGKPLLYLVFEYIETDLNKFIDTYRKGPNPGPLPPSLVQSFLYQLCKGVAHCHSHGVLHRDLKPQNLLVDKDKGILKIADLGLGRAFTVPLKSYTHEIGTRRYSAPEVLLGSRHYSTGVDMWSVGCIFAEMAMRQALFPGDSDFQQLLLIFRMMGTPTEKQLPGVSSLQVKQTTNLACAVPALEPDGVDLLSKMLKYDPAERISAKAALDHPFFNSLDKSQF